MKFETTVVIHLNEEENSAWHTLYRAVSDLAHNPCEDVETAEAVNDFYEAMQNFAGYLRD